jgi:hypothetical protein
VPLDDDRLDRSIHAFHSQESGLLSTFGKDKIFVFADGLLVGVFVDRASANRWARRNYGENYLSVSLL